MRFSIVTFAAALSCTSGPAHAAPKYVPSSAYRGLTWDQLAKEGRAISRRRGFEALGLRAGQGGTDATAAPSEIVIVWPIKIQALDTQQSEKFALAEGQMDAIEQASVEGQCSIRFQRPNVQ